MISQLYKQANAVLTFLSLLFLAFATGANAAPADFDASFGANGKSVVPVGNGNSFILDAALQGDGKIVAVGAVALNGSDFCVVRYNQNGSLDQTFGNGGVVYTDLGSANDSAKAVAIQPDGKIIAAGATLVNNRLDFAVVRYNADGSLDANFGDAGKVVTSVDQWGDVALSIALMADGRIIVAGYSEDGSFDERFAAVRYNPNGTVDNSFGADGKTTVAVGANSQGAKDVLLMPDGKIILAGSGATGNTGTDFILARLNSNGTLDNSFDGDGKVVTSISVTDIANAAVLQPDGKIIVAGYADDANSSSKFAAVRYNPNGTKDNAFGVFGTVTAQIGANFEDAATAVSLQADGKILLGGATKTGFENYDLALMRLTISGAPDSTFGTGGKVILPISNKDDSMNDLIIQPNGRILLAGASLDAAQRFSFTLVRLLGRHTATDFDSDGKADITVFRPAIGTWYLNRSTVGFGAAQFGSNGDKPLTADFDGDARNDLAVFRPANGTWYLQQSTGGFAAYQFGVGTDIPVAADYYNSGRADIAVFRPSNGTWYIRTQVGLIAVQFGQNGDIPQPADYDRDGKADIAVFRPSNGTWYVQGSARGFFAVQFGTAGDIPTAADFDGDLAADAAVFRPSNGTWYVLKSSSNELQAMQWGTNGDRPMAADFDADGKADYGVFRQSNGSWYVLQSGNNQLFSQQFGASSDIPVSVFSAQ